MKRITDNQYRRSLKVCVDYEKQLQQDVSDAKKRLHGIRWQNIEMNGRVVHPDMNIVDCSASVRLLNVIKANACSSTTSITMTLRELSEIPLSEIHNWRNMGNKSIDELIGLVTMAGLKMK